MTKRKTSKEIVLSITTGGGKYVVCNHPLHTGGTLEGNVRAVGTIEEVEGIVASLLRTGKFPKK